MNYMGKIGIFPYLIRNQIHFKIQDVEFKSRRYALIKFHEEITSFPLIKTVRIQSEFNILERQGDIAHKED